GAPLGDGHAARRGREGVVRRELGIHGEAERGGLRRQGARGAREGDGDRARGSRGVGRQRQRARRRRGVRAEGRGDAAWQPGGGQGDAAGEAVLRRDGDRARAGAPLGDGHATRRGGEGVVGRGRGVRGEEERGGLRRKGGRGGREVASARDVGGGAGVGLGDQDHVARWL